MYLDFEDHRPEAPRVPSVITRREGVLLSLVFHLTLVIVILLAPTPGPSADEVVPVVPAPDEDVQFVYMEPLVERPAPPPPRACRSVRG